MLITGQYIACLHAVDKEARLAAKCIGPEPKTANALQTNF